MTIPKGGSTAKKKKKNAPGKRIEHFTEETKAKGNDK